MLIPIFIIIVLAVALFVGAKVLRNPADQHPGLAHVPGPKPDRIFGNFRQVEDPKFMAPSWLAMNKQYGDVFCFYMLNMPVVIVSEPKLIRKLLVDRDGYQRGEYPWGLIRFFTGKAIFSTDGEEWKHRRAILNPLFQMKTVNSLLPAINERCLKFAEIIDGSIAKSETLELVHLFHPLTLDVIGVFLMGRKLNALESTLSTEPSIAKTLSTYFEQMTPVMKNRTLFGKLATLLPSHSRFVRNYSKPYWELVHKIVQDRQAEIAAGAPLENVLIDALLDPKHELTEQDVCDELSGFILAGHETTANTLALVLAKLLYNPDKLEELMKELDRVFPDKPTADYLVSIDDVKKLSELKYLNAVIKETLRLHPLVPSHFGTLVQDRQVGDYHLPAGTNVIVSIYNSQHNEKYFPEPTKFMPERFMLDKMEDEVATSQQEKTPAEAMQQAWLPFYGGAHLCIGMNIAMLELRVVLAFLFKNYELRTPEGYQPIIKSVLTLTVANGLPIYFKRRT